MRNSKQREIILNIVNNSMDHPNACMIYDLAIKQIPNISLGTVYRNLNLLADMKQIRKISIPGGCDRFDRILNEHSHFLCEKCNKVYDIDNNILKKLKLLTESDTGHKINENNILFTGVCNNCLSNEREME